MNKTAPFTIMTFCADKPKGSAIWVSLFPFLCLLCRILDSQLLQKHKHRYDIKVKMKTSDVSPSLRATLSQFHTRTFWGNVAFEIITGDGLQMVFLKTSQSHVVRMEIFSKCPKTFCREIIELSHRTHTPPHTPIDYFRKKGTHTNRNALLF